MKSSLFSESVQSLIQKTIEQKKSLVLRIPPSPTGSLHLGTARTAIYNWLLSKKYTGKFLLRLEDTDRQRSESKYVSEIINGLKWLGISWDEGPFRQSEHSARHNFVLEELKKKELVYECYCTKEELDKLRLAQKKSKQAPRYDNRHRNLTAAEKENFRKAGRKPVLRVKVPENKEISWFDLIKEKITVNSSDLGGDFVVGRENGEILYNFAVVVDDHDQGVNLILRGEDHLHNTAKQILLYELLEWDLPLFAHVPLILNTDQQKLSKRKHGDLASIRKYQKEGYLPEAIVNYLVAMSWQLKDHSKKDTAQELFSLAEIIEHFTVDSISKSSAIYDSQKLSWFSREYFKKLSAPEILELLNEYFQREKDSSLESFLSQKQEFKLAVLTLVKERLSKLSEVPELVDLFLNAPNLSTISPEDKIIICKQESKEVLRVFKQILSDSLDLPSLKSLKAKELLQQLSEKTKIKKGKNLFFPLRVALWGKTQGPDLVGILEILDKESLILRLQRAIEF